MPLLLFFRGGGGNPPTVCRQCRRLAEPSSLTVEHLVGANLSVSITLPIDIVYKYASMLPNNGPDTLTIAYTDYQGQSATLTRSVTFWMSDAGYAIVSPDRKTQLLVSGVNGTFFNANATAINARNVAAGAVGLLPCCNTARYDAAVLLPNQNTPTLWIRDGSSMSN